MRRRDALALLGAGLIARPALAQTRTIVDSAGRKVTLPARIDRLFVAGPPASVLAYTLARDAMVGWIRTPSPAEKEFLAAPARDLPETGRLTGRGDTVSLERLVAAKPDMVLDFGSVSETFVSLADRVQSQTGIPYALIDGRFAATAASLKLAGDMLGRAERAANLAAYAEASFAMVDRVLARVPADRRPRVYLARGAEGLETGSRGSINTEIIEHAGAVNVAQGLGGSGNISNASLEQIIAWQPDIIVTLDRTFFTNVKTKPGWNQVRAVANNRVHLAPSLPWGWIDAPPSLNRLIGLRWLLSLFYPTEAGIDLRAETRGFYELFYGVVLTDEQLARLLGGTAN
ncbi:iron ABC transporter substrate-binding protein [Reyranella sp.]|uniref:iron ABC transporter substrate-binding protein n=1 Tax=Reyranella sp. TaxID=1929291 RepID=UPI0011F5F865|nr:iron ABC transporter substrate-binding protein [Reyranella sp.]TAJ84920.1 MAG: iron ABC transporter substrate-binding protein [Reyranella sp.]